MRAVILQEPGRIVHAEVEDPRPGPGDLLLRVRAATTCGTDLKAFLRGHPAIPMPGVFGHEYAGVVVEAGEGAGFRPGDEVMGVHSAPCKACRWCRDGQENLCESLMSTKVLGSFAELLLIPARIARLNVFPKPPTLPFPLASLLEPLSCVAQGLMELAKCGFPGASPSERSVAVVGPGAIGLMFVAALRRLGVGKVVLAGRNPLRLAVGESLGAETAHLQDLRPLDGVGFDAVIECVGVPTMWERSSDWVRRGGWLMLFGGCPPGTKACFDTRRLHYDQITVLSPFHFGTAAVATAREWLTSGMLGLERLITGTACLEEAASVFDRLRNGVGIKYVFQP
ncbi:MAG: alcohol dehydrogenase catalytic domain-containing protein [Fimbriimonadales bacterium]|nr:alcohol dehydrogenase catalytic domain-containing protein [Fimbriimonadales bacterium]